MIIDDNQRNIYLIIINLKRKKRKSYLQRIKKKDQIKKATTFIYI